MGLGSILLVGLCVLVAAGAAMNLFEWYEEKWPVCPHGVRGGKTRNHCVECVHERKSLEEKLHLQKVNEAIRQEILRDADRLREREWQRLASSLVPSLDELRGLTWQQFEDEIARMFERMGYSVEQTPYTNDGGRDAILIKDGVKYLLECKKYADGGQSGRPDLQKFHSAIITDKAKSGFFVSAGAFTKEAVEWAATMPMELIDGQKLVRLMFHSKPAASDDDNYQSACRTCGKIVIHRLRAPNDVTCSEGHVVQPSLTLERLLADGLNPQPSCLRCGVPMRLVDGRKGKFWGCSNYFGTPRCTYTAQYKGSGKDLPTLDGLQITPDIVKAFKKAGYPPLAQGDIGTAAWWLGHGYSIKALELPIKCKGGHLRLYHRSQVVERATAASGSSHQF